MNELNSQSFSFSPHSCILRQSKRELLYVLDIKKKKCPAMFVKENSWFCSGCFFFFHSHYTWTLMHGAFWIFVLCAGSAGRLLGSVLKRSCRFTGNTDHLAQAPSWGALSRFVNHILTAAEPLRLPRWTRSPTRRLRCHRSAERWFSSNPCVYGSSLVHVLLLY